MKQLVETMPASFGQHVDDVEHSVAQPKAQKQQAVIHSVVTTLELRRLLRDARLELVGEKQLLSLPFQLP